MKIIYKKVSMMTRIHDAYVRSRMLEMPIERFELSKLEAAALEEEMGRVLKEYDEIPIVVVNE